MTSPNVQIQNLIRRYVRERDGTYTMNQAIDTLFTPPKSGNAIGKPHLQDAVCYNLTLPDVLHTSHLHSYKYVIDIPMLSDTNANDNIEAYKNADVNGNVNADVKDDLNPNIVGSSYPEYDSNHHDEMFPMELNENLQIQALKFPHPNITDLSHNSEKEIMQYMGADGLFNNIYGAELVDEKWLLYAFIISKINRTFKKNMLVDHIQIKSLHIGDDTGSVQAALNHLFTASDSFRNVPVHWKWVSLDWTNRLYHTHKSNFVPILKSKSIWDQIVFIINKTAEMHERYGLVIFQPDRDTNSGANSNSSNNINSRNQYLYAVIMSLRFTDPSGVFLLEFNSDTVWSTLEVNIIGLCGLIFDLVYITKYEIIKCHYVLVCSDKKKNISTNSIIKKLIKLLLESDSVCVLDKSTFTSNWLNNLSKSLSDTQIEPISFMQIVNSINGILSYNEQPIGGYL